MKINRLLFALICFLILSSCHSDNDQPNLTFSPTLEGEWKLVNVKGGITGTDDNFPDGLITWKVNGISQTIQVVNNNTNEQLQDILESGTYHYTFVTNEATPELCNTNITIDGVNLGCYNISAQEFTMSQIETDGFLIKLVR